MFKRIGSKEGLMASGSVFLMVSTLFVVLLGIGAVVSMGLLTSDPANRNNVITVQGTGEAFAVPDIATFTFTARDEAETVKEAQENVSKQLAGVFDALDNLGIEEKDIRTTSYNSYPRYEWRQEKVICNEFGCPPSQGKRELTGYEQTQSVQVKVRDLEQVSDVLQVLGDANVDSMNGPNFTVDDEDAVLTEARKEAIAKARQKAEELAAELGVSLGKVVNFSDHSGGYYPSPVMARSLAVEEFAAMDMGFAPELPVGENRVTANVSITFKIK